MFKKLSREIQEEVDLFDIEVASEIQNGEDGSSSSETRKGFVINVADFGPLKELVVNPLITDVDFNGSDLWITDVYNHHWKANSNDLMNEEYTIEDVNPRFIRCLAQKIANANAVEFNQKKPILEAETTELRIAVLDYSLAPSGTSMCIRKIPTVERITEKQAIDNNYATRQTLSLIANLVKAHMNVIVCGQPRAGKTELAKFISKYIPSYERVITIEDVLEWHYKELNEGADCISMKTNEDVGYTDCIVASLKQNPKWLMIAETRGEEVRDLITGFTTGVNGITTLHTDDVRKIPDRIVNMVNDSVTSERLKNNVYEFVHVGILVSMRSTKDGGAERFIDQVGFFTRENGKNEAQLIMNAGVPYNTSLKPLIADKFAKAGISDIWQNDDVDMYLKEQGYDFEKEQNLLEKHFAFSDEDLEEMLNNATTFSADDENIERKVFERLQRKDA